MKTRFLAAAVAIATAGCATPQPPPPAPPGETLTPITAEGDYMHEPSHFPFPAQVAGFNRVTLFARGSDRITAGYFGGPPECPTAITLWIDPAAAQGQAAELTRLEAGKRIDEAFALGKAEVARTHPDAVVDTEEAGGNPVMPGRRATYAMGDRRLDMVVFLVGNEWYLRYWVIYPARCAQQGQAQADRFFGGWRR